MKRPKFNLSTWGILLGALLIAASLIWLVTAELLQSSAVRDAQKAVAALRAAMPVPYDTVPDDRVEMTMPAMMVEGESFCGIIEVPAYSRELPIREVWDSGAVSVCPCRYMGSIYNGSLIIGGSDSQGQFDFIRKIGNGDKIFVTDMAGGRYTYAVTDIRRSDDVSTAYLTSIDFDLVLFAKNSFAFDYTVIRCKLDLQG